MAEERVRYGDADLAEFKQIILKKLEQARADYELLRSTITHSGDNDTEDTSPTFKVLEEGATTLSKEESGRLAAHQLKFIRNLEMALVRVENTASARPQANLSPRSVCCVYPMLRSASRPRRSASRNPDPAPPHKHIAQAHRLRSNRHLDVSSRYQAKTEAGRRIR